jgi:hypothetical protein
VEPNQPAPWPFVILAAIAGAAIGAKKVYRHR